MSQYPATQQFDLENQLDATPHVGQRHSLFLRWAPQVIALYCLFAALSIAASRIIVVALSIWWLCTSLPSIKQAPAERKMLAAYFLFLGCALLAAVFGIQANRALTDTAKLGFALVFPFAVASTLDPRSLPRSEAIGRIEYYLLMLVLGQSLAALHSIASQYYGQELPIGIPGPVTESGQLVLVLSILVGLSLRCYTATPLAMQLRHWLHSIGITVLCCLAAWPQMLSERFAQELQAAAVLSLFVLFALVLVREVARKGVASASFHKLRPILLALLLGALLCNLKRGPWLGVFTALLLFGAFYSKRLVYSVCGIVFAALAFIEPVQQRVMAFAAHFSIAGGRQNMWEIGFNLAQRFPLGLGLDNARYMQVIDPSLPDLHRHMHNNLLNIAVETGYLGLMSYLWWIVLLCALGLNAYRTPQQSISAMRLKVIAVAITAALIGWQVSGLVEYNFGDGEIRLIAFLYIGILIAITRQFQQQEDNDQGATVLSQRENNASKAIC